MSNQKAPKIESSKGPLNRDVVRVITPGTLTEETLLEAKRHNFLLSLCDEPQGRPPSQTASIGIAFVDISTGDFWTEFQPLSEINAVLARVQPREILLPEKLIQKPDLFEVWADWKTALKTLPDSRFNLGNGARRLQNLYLVAHLNVFGSAFITLWPVDSKFDREKPAPYNLPFDC